MARPKLPPIQARMLALLSDGQPHTKEELRGCLDDELAGDTAVKFHISKLRSTVRKDGQDIVCSRHAGPTTYRHVQVSIPTPGVTTD